MNKTITITIGGQIFHVEEDAYQELNDYLSQIKEHLGADSNEIMADIETSIAEKFENLISTNRQAISKEDVKNLIKIMGTVEDFIEADNTTNQKIQIEKKETEINKNRLPKKLYRDNDDKIIAGVCSGLAMYFGIDPVFVRLVFVASIFFGGAGIPIYLILWIAMPIAKTSAQKLEMQGDPITLAHLEEIGKEKIQAAKESSKKGFIRDLISLPIILIKLIADIFKKLIPLVLIIAGVCLTFGSLFAVGALSFFVAILIFNPNSPYIISSFPVKETIGNLNYFTGLISVYLTALIPVLSIILLGITMIRRKNFFTILTTSSLITFWMIAIIATGVVAVRVAPVVETKIGELRKTSNQIQKEYDFKDFKKISIQGDENVTIKQGEIFRITAMGQERDLEKLRISSENGELKINQQDLDGICLFCFSQKINIEITMPELTSLTSSGMVESNVKGFNENKFSAKISGLSNSTIHLSAEILDLEIKNSAEASLSGTSSLSRISATNIAQFTASDFFTRELDLQLENAAEANLNGSAEKMKAELNNSSELDAFEFRVDNLEIFAQNASEAKVFASSTLSIKAENASTVNFRGQAKVEKEVDNGSEVIAD